jgi:S-adenosylmethionine hydrolase
VVIVSLLSDFGLADTYAGQMKAAILAVAADVDVVDLTHSVPAQDVFEGAFHLWAAVEVFPAGSVHLAVVDPGVGSARRAIAARSGRGDVFVGPDNGLLLPAIDRLGGSTLAVELTNTEYWRKAQPSVTFHGRDIFGPVAGHIASGVLVERLGTPIEQLNPEIQLQLAEGLDGEVIHVDTYGNLITSIRAHNLPPRFRVALGSQIIDSAPNYAAAQPHGLVALVGSTTLLEIAARDASASTLTQAHRGTRLSVIAAE